MSGLIERLEGREKQGNPVRVGVVGTGYMGSGVINSIGQAHGMEVAALWGETGKQEAENAARRYGLRGARIAGTIAELCSVDGVEVVVDATSSPLVGAEAAMRGIENSKHIVSINIECDVTVGDKLKRAADGKGVVYTVTAGDEPGELKLLYDHYWLLGFRIIALGKGKNNALNVSATPETVAKNLPDNGITASQVASFVDGSKTMFEMACVSNATGLVPGKRGMHGPPARLDELAGIYRSRKKGGILDTEGVVDYVTGSELSGGIFIVVTTDNERIRQDFSYLKIGSGENYAFYQRYHNWFIDTPISIAGAVLNHEATVAPLAVKSSEVVAVAKRDLRAGEKLDGIGGYAAYGEIVLAETARQEAYLPHGLSEICKVRRDLKKGTSIRIEDVDLNRESDLWKIWSAPALG